MTQQPTDETVYKLKRKHSKNKVYKTFSANFLSQRYKNAAVLNEESHEPEPDDDDDGKKKKKPSRKKLCKENHKLLNENNILATKLEELERLSITKITKLREKINKNQQLSTEILSRNEEITQEYQRLSANYELLKSEYVSIQASLDELKVTLENYRRDNLNLTKINDDHSNDVTMLKTLVYRLNLQLERYQEKLSSKDSDNNDLKNPGAVKIIQIPTPTPIDEHSPFSWGKVNTHTLAPLLNAYQDTLEDKEEIIQKYDQEMTKCTGALKEVIKENESLHSRMTENEARTSKMRLEVERIQDELKTLQQTNDLLTRKCTIKQEKLSEVVKCYEVKIEQLKRDYNVLFEEYQSNVVENKRTKTAHSESQTDLRKELENFIPVSIYKANVNECKRWYEELKSQYQEERRKIEDNLKEQTNLVDALNQKISSLTIEKTRLENEIDRLKSDDSKKISSRRFSDVRKQLTEIKSSRDICRKHLKQAIAFAKDLMLEQESLIKMLSEKQKESANEKERGAEMAARLEYLKRQLKTVQKDAWTELDTVEKRIEEQNDVIAVLKEEHSRETGELRELVKRLEDENEALKRENKNPRPPYLLLKDRTK